MILTISSATKPHPDSKLTLGKPIQSYDKFCSKHKEIFQQFQQLHQSSSLQPGYLSCPCLKNGEYCTQKIQLEIFGMQKFYGDNIKLLVR